MKQQSVHTRAKLNEGAAPSSPRWRGEGVAYKQSRLPYLLGAALVAALAAVIAFAVHSCSISAVERDAAVQAANEAAAEQQTLSLSDAMLGEGGVNGLPAKLQGSTETTDENGIVHGTTPDGISYTVYGRGQLGTNSDRVTLAAIGDVIATEYALTLADAYSGATDDGVYDFSSWFSEVAPMLQAADISFANQETVLGGTDGRSYSGYPMFNSPDSVVDAEDAAGIDLLNFATNHIYDCGEAGILRSHEVLDAHPNLLVGGSYTSAEERDTVHMVERNGMTFAFLAYTYGDNSYSDASNMPNDYYLCTFDKERIAADVERAKSVADAVIVAMHWGTEYVNDPNDQQRDYAAYLADLDVDLVLGTHCHTIQPVEYVTGESGNTIPVVFGLSDFMSAWTITDCIVCGVFTCDFVPDGQDGVTVENLCWTPAIEWSDGSSPITVRLLANMDEAETNANTRTPDVTDDYTYLRELTNSVITQIPVAWE